MLWNGTYLFLILHSVTSHWYHKIDYGRITSKCCRPGHFLLGKEDHQHTTERSSVKANCLFTLNNNNNNNKHIKNLPGHVSENKQKREKIVKERQKVDG